MTERKSAEKGMLIVVSGPAGSGKGTVLKELMAMSDSFVYSVSATTRAPRPGETDGIHYFFRTREQFEESIDKGKMLEYAQYVGNYYGTPRDFVNEKIKQGKNVILEIETVGALQIRRKVHGAVLIFLCPPDEETLYRRLTGRGTEDITTVQKRMEQARTELERMKKYDYLVINEENGAKKAAEEILDIVHAESAARRKRAFPKKFYAHSHPIEK